MIRIPLAVYMLTAVGLAQASANEVSVETLIHESTQKLFNQIHQGARKLQEAA